MEANEFKVGVKFKYMGDNAPSEKYVIQTVTKIEHGLVYTDLNDTSQKAFMPNFSYAKSCVHANVSDFNDLIESIFNIFSLKEKETLTNDEIRTKIEKELTICYSIGFKDGENNIKNQLKEKLKEFID